MQDYCIIYINKIHVLTNICTSFPSSAGTRIILKVMGERNTNTGFQYNGSWVQAIFKPSV